MAARPLHLFEAGVVTEQRFMGLQEAPAALGPLLADRLGAEKRVRSARSTNDAAISGRASRMTVKWQSENTEGTLWSATMADGRQGWFEIQLERSPNG